MIFVTGDVHDGGMGGRDQAWMRRHGRAGEIPCAERYADLAARHGVPVTLFLTGRCALEAPDALRRLADNPSVTIGGHTWNGLQPVWRHLLRQRLHGSFYGTAAAQAKDVARTLDALGVACGRPVHAWRTHAFRGDAHTWAVLANTDVRIVSDHVDPLGHIERLSGGLVSVPINTTPDHDGMLHGAFAPEHLAREEALRADPWLVLRSLPGRGDLARAGKELAKRGLGIPRPPASPARETPAAWWRRVRGEIDRRLEGPGYAMVLLHPACMEIADGMVLLDAIFRDLASLPCRPLLDATRGC